MKKKSILIVVVCIIFIFSHQLLNAQTWKVLQKELNESVKNGDTETALSLAEQALPQAKKEFGTKHKNYAISLFDLGSLYKEVSRYEEAEVLITQAIEIAKKKHGFKKEYIDYSVKLAELYEELGQYEDALKLSNEVLALIDKSKKRDNLQYVNFIIVIATVYTYIGELEESLSLNLQALEIVEKEFGKNDYLYGVQLNNIGILFFYLGEFDKSLSYLTQALNYTREFNGLTHPDYILRLNNLSGIYQYLNYFEKSELLLKEARELILKKYDKSHLEYAYNSNGLGTLYSEIGRYEEAEVFLSETLELFEIFFGKKHNNYASVLNNLANLYAELGNYSKALELSLQTVNITKNTLGTKHKNYFVELNNLASLYLEFGLFDKAEDNLNEIFNNIDNEDEDKYCYLRYLDTQAILYIRQNKFDQALEILLNAKQIAENFLGKNNLTYSSILNSIGYVYNNLMCYDEAIQALSESIEITENLVGKTHPYISTRLSKLALSYQQLGNYDEALDLFLQAIEITEKTLGKTHPKYSIQLNNLACLFLLMGQTDNVLPLYQKSLENDLFNLRENLIALGEKDKEHFAYSVVSSLNMYQSFFMDYYPTDNSVADYAYNIELALKGMILQSSVENRKVILTSENETAIEKYNEWIGLKNILAKQYSLQISERRPDLIELEKRADEIEGQLCIISKSFNEGSAIGSKTWKDIQEQLTDNEVAIEFSSFNYKGKYKWTDSTMYAAILIRKGDKNPILIPLFEEKQLDNILASNNNSLQSVNSMYRGVSFLNQKQTNFSGQNLFNIIWQPIEKYLNAGNTIYFSPAGLLNTIAFGALPIDKNILLSDKYNLIQLSTTAKLLSPVETDIIKDIALFGGINYDLESNELFALAEDINYDHSSSRSLDTSLNRGNENWNYLPGTLDEVENINITALTRNIESYLYIGNFALEERFKSLSGKNSPSIIHIATHGFYFDKPKSEYKEDKNILFFDDQVYKSSDNPLNRSGLLFAGANINWNSNTTSDLRTDDGVLTAFEVTNVILSNTKLVVLSACETGKGAVSNNEGVYGLQRAFKASGVEYLIMSLWQVPDKETSEFMQTFYVNYFDLNDVPKAFKETQNYMKNKYRDEPYKWAAFILMR